MDENLTSSVLHGCKLARDVERNLPMMATQPEILRISCDEIVRVFSSIRERLITIPQGHVTTRQLQQPQEWQHLADDRSAGVQEWLRTSYAATTTTSVGRDQSIDSLINDQPTFGGKPKGANPTTTLGPKIMVGGSSSEMKHSEVNAPDFTRTSSSMKQRKRPIEGYKIVKRVPAPQMGNLDLPPEDGYTWRKYGQKEILGSTYPRSYYRCTHQKFYDCPAKKQVQRLEDDPFTFEVTYRDTHTCHVYEPPATTSAMEAPPPPIISFSSPSVLPAATQWLSMQVVGGGGAGPSVGRFPEYGQLQVADMADAMFNSASSSSNSMDLIFSSMDEYKWDSLTEEKKD